MTQAAYSFLFLFSKYHINKAYHPGHVLLQVFPQKYYIQPPRFSFIGLSIVNAISYKHESHQST